MCTGVWMFESSGIKNIIMGNIDITILKEIPNLTEKYDLIIEPLAPLSMVEEFPGSFYKTLKSPSKKMICGLFENILGWHLGWQDRKQIMDDIKKIRKKQKVKFESMQNGSTYIPLLMEYFEIEDNTAINYTASYSKSEQGTPNYANNNGNKIYLDNIPGTWTIHLEDIVGNVKEYTVIVDSNKPVIKLNDELDKTNKSGDYYNYNPTITWNDDNFSHCVIEKSTNNANSWSIIDNNYTSSSFTTNSSGSYLDSWRITVYDKAGQKSTYQFYVDLQTPSFQYVTTTSETFDGLNYFTKNVEFIWIQDPANGYKYKLDDSDWIITSSNKLTVSDDGRHIFILSDAAGNEITYEFIIEQNSNNYSFLLQNKPADANKPDKFQEPLYQQISIRNYDIAIPLRYLF